MEINNEDIDYILDYFDFEKVKQVMDCLEWYWHSSENGVPSIGELRKCARRLLKEVLEEGMKSKKSIILHATGGFKATYHKGELSLEFIVTEGSNEDLITERNEDNVE